MVLSCMIKKCHPRFWCFTIRAKPGKVTYLTISGKNECWVTLTTLMNFEPFSSCFAANITSYNLAGLGTLFLWKHITCRSLRGSCPQQLALEFLPITAETLATVSLEPLVLYFATLRKIADLFLKFHDICDQIWENPAYCLFYEIWVSLLQVWDRSCASARVHDRTTPTEIERCYAHV